MCLLMCPSSPIGMRRLSQKENRVGSSPTLGTNNLWKCGRVRFIATVLKTVVSKGTVSSNLTVSAKFCLCVYGYPYVSSELTKSLITVPEARSKSGSMPDSAHALDSM